MSRLLPSKTPLPLAFFLPQYHPIPENNKWWGNGFTEWTKVTRGQPLFDGHQQPRLPADVGFYDLRLPEVRELQADLARQAGLGGFIYYHYWFNGHRLLERPFEEVLKSKRPDFPFCLCWANESWSRNWDGGSRDILMAQSYSTEDDENHIKWLLKAFADDRYIKIDGRPLFFIYRPTDLPDMQATAERWRAAARKNGFPDLYLCMVRSFYGEFSDPSLFGLDASAEFKPNGTDCGPRLQSDDPLEIGYRLHRVWDYERMVHLSLSTPTPSFKFFPGVCPSWDNSVRRKEDGIIFRGATPELYGAWLKSVMRGEIHRAQTESVVIINAWNEWAEGNHLEPCQRWGRRYIDATKAAITAASEYFAAITSLEKGMIMPLSPKPRIRSYFDHIKRSIDEFSVAGWAVQEDTLEPADLLVFARRNEAGEFTLIEALTQQRQPRPDVADHVGSSEALLCGWKGSYQPAPGEARIEDVHVLAVDLKKRSAVLLTPPQ